MNTNAHFTETIQSYSDDELKELITLAEQELTQRAKKLRQDTIDEIKRLAASVEVEIHFGNGRRGRRAATSRNVHRKEATMPDVTTAAGKNVSAPPIKTGSAGKLHA